MQEVLELQKTQLAKHETGDTDEPEMTDEYIKSMRRWCELNLGLELQHEIAALDSKTNSKWIVPAGKWWEELLISRTEHWRCDSRLR